MQDHYDCENRRKCLRFLGIGNSRYRGELREGKTLIGGYLVNGNERCSIFPGFYTVEPWSNLDSAWIPFLFGRELRHLRCQWNINKTKNLKVSWVVQATTTIRCAGKLQCRQRQKKKRYGHIRTKEAACCFIRCPPHITECNRTAGLRMIWTMRVVHIVHLVLGRKILAC